MENGTYCYTYSHEDGVHTGTRSDFKNGQQGRRNGSFRL